MIYTFIWLFLFWPAFLTCNYLMHLAGNNLINHSEVKFLVWVWLIVAFIIYEEDL